ncbi:MAG TPA: hypothetical protein VM687_04885 [Stenotrophomonas sp.]|nr:hypothetical protein [Stenotrophomonas sp.]
MPSGYANPAGTDLDDVFDAYVQGDRAIATGYFTSDGNDLNQRYAPLIFGAKAADVGYSDNSGTDVSNRFAAKGTAQYTLAFHGKFYQTTRLALTNENTNVSAVTTISLAANGTWGIGAANGSPTSGTWLPAGRSVSEYSIQIEVSGNSRVTVTNGAASYVPASSGAGATFQATVRGASSDNIEETLTVRVNLRHSSGLVTTSTFSAYLKATGYL